MKGASALDNIQFGQFVAHLRKEKNITQKELADRLHVTDKAVSKWETGKGFPDLKLLEPLAQELGVSLVELLQGERTPSPTLTKEEAGQAAVQAMEQSQKNTARRYLKLFRWVLTAGAALCAFPLAVRAFLAIEAWLTEPAYREIIGRQDGPTAILVATPEPIFPPWFYCGALMLTLVICVVLAIRVRRLERRLK